MPTGLQLTERLEDSCNEEDEEVYDLVVDLVDSPPEINGALGEHGSDSTLHHNFSHRT